MMADADTASNLILTRQERSSARERFGSSGVLKELVLEVTGDPSWQLAQFLHEPLELARQLLAVLREPVGIDVGLQIAVQVLVGVPLRRVLRQVEHLDLL